MSYVSTINIQSRGGGDGRGMSNGNYRPPPSRGMSDRSIKIRQGQPVAERKGAKSGWGQRESVVKPSIAVQGMYNSGSLCSFYVICSIQMFQESQTLALDSLFLVGFIYSSIEIDGSMYKYGRMVYRCSYL